MAAAVKLGMVLIAGPAVKDEPIVEKLDVAFLDVHVEEEFGRGGQPLDFVECLLLTHAQLDIASGRCASGVSGKVVAGELSARPAEDRYRAVAHGAARAVLRIEPHPPIA